MRGILKGREREGERVFGVLVSKRNARLKITEKMAFGFFVFVPKKEKVNQFSSQISLLFSLSLFVLKSRGSLFLSEKMEMKIRDREKYSRDKKQEKPNKKKKKKKKKQKSNSFPRV